MKLFLCLSAAALTIAVVIVMLWPFGARAAGQVCGTASWYGIQHQGRTMANGKPFNRHALTAASWGYPFGTKLRVTRGSYSVVVTITDRGPAKRLHRIIDLSEAAALKLHMRDAGTGRVCLSRL